MGTLDTDPLLHLVQRLDQSRRQREAEQSGSLSSLWVGLWRGL